MRIIVQTKTGAQEFDCGADEKILHAGLRQGIALPYECGTGTCGTCKARTVSGPVDPGWREAPGHSYLKAEKNEFLLCQGTASGDCTIMVPGKPPLDSAPFPKPRHHRGVIGSCSVLTQDVVSFTLMLEERMDFLPGQFAIIEAPGIDGGRAYSMVNFAAQTDTLEFVIKRKPGGRFCDWMFSQPRDGTPIRVFGPLGRAVFRPEENKNILCIAGGSGIAGIMSILSRANDADYFATHKGSVFFGVRTANDGFFLERMNAFADTGENLEIVIALSEGAAPSTLRASYPGLRFESGFVHAVAARQMAGKFENVTAFVAGPPPMVDGALRMLIMEARLPAKDIRYDKFG